MWISRLKEVLYRKDGRGLHHLRFHKAWYDERILGNRQPVRPVWSAEESAMMAKRKAELTLQEISYINVKLRVGFYIMAESCGTAAVR